MDEQFNFQRQPPITTGVNIENIGKKSYFYWHAYLCPNESFESAHLQGLNRNERNAQSIQNTEKTDNFLRKSAIT